MEQKSLEILSARPSVAFEYENQDVTVRLFYDERGLDRYYGLLENYENSAVRRMSQHKYIDKKGLCESNPERP